MEKRSRKGWILPVLVLVFAGGITWWWLESRNKHKPAGETAKDQVSNAGHEAKENMAKLTMDVASMSITGIENGRIRVANTVVINNPLPVPLHISRLDYTVLANSVKVAEGAYTKPIRVPAMDDTTVTLPMQVLVKPLDKVNDATGSDSATYHFLHTIYTDVPIAGKRKIPYHVKERLPVVRSPEVKLGKMDIEKFGLKNAGMDITLQVINPNSFEIRMADGRSTMSIDGEHTMTGTTQDLVVLPPKQTTPVVMHMRMKTGRALKTGWKMLFDKKDTRYSMTFDSKVLSDAKLLRNSTMHFSDEGSLKDLIETIRKQDRTKK